MSSGKIDVAWRMLVVAAIEVVNPLLLISLALFCGAGYILTLLLPVDIDMWVAVLWASLLLPLIGLLIRARRLWERAQQEIPPFHWRALIPLLAVAALLPAGYFIYSYPSFRAISHSDLYFVYVSQLFDGFTPPENAVSPGSAALHYWLFHAAVATLVKLTTLDVYSTANLVNFPVYRQQPVLACANGC